MSIVAKGSGKPSRGVGAARLNQRTGTSNSFGGYTKVRRSDGSFTMRKSSPGPGGGGGGAYLGASSGGGTMSVGSGWGSEALSRAVTDAVVARTDSFVAKFDPENRDLAYAAAHGAWSNLVRTIETVAGILGEGTAALLDRPTTSIGAPACWTRHDSPLSDRRFVESHLMRAGLFDDVVFRPQLPVDLLRLPHLVALRGRCAEAYVELDNTRLWLEAVTDAGEDADLHARLFEEVEAWTARAAEVLPALDAALSTAARPLTEGGLQTLPQQLAQLAELHDLGALSDEEFAQAKSQVLGGSAQP